MRNKWIFIYDHEKMHDFEKILEMYDTIEIRQYSDNLKKGDIVYLFDDICVPFHTYILEVEENFKKENHDLIFDDETDNKYVFWYKLKNLNKNLLRDEIDVVGNYIYCYLHSLYLENRTLQIPIDERFYPKLFGDDYSKIMQKLNSVDEKYDEKYNFLTSNQAKSNTNSPYYIYYLHKDFVSDKVAKDFMDTYGGEIDKLSSANVTVVTGFTEDMVDKWTNVYDRQRLENDANDKNYRDLLESADWNKLPYLVIKKEGEKSIIEISLDGYEDPADIYNIFEEVVRKINANCEEDFNDIKKLFNTNESENSVFEDNLLRNLCKTHDVNLEDVAGAINISSRQLENKRKNKTITRDECFIIAFFLKLSIKELDKLLWDNELREIFFNGRDGIIRRNICENNNIKWDIALNNTNDELGSKNFQKINAKKQDQKIF